MSFFSFINFNSVPLNDLCEYVTDRFHTEVVNSIALINIQIEKVPARACKVDLIALKSKFSNFQKLLENHLRKESTILFPFVQTLMSSDSTKKTTDHRLDMLENSIAILSAEHRSLEQELNAIRSLTGDYRPDCAGDSSYLCFVSLFDLDVNVRRLIYLEEMVLYKRMLEAARNR